MLDGVTLDQLRALVTVVEEGSFSAAARKLQRVQSAVSTAMSNLETQLGIRIWDRSTKIATLTEQGRAVLVAARRVLSEMDGLWRLTSGLSTGLEASVALCVDALFPLQALLDLCSAFTKEFPSVDLRIDTQLMSAVSARVLSGVSTLGVVSPLGIAPGLERHVLTSVRMLPVVRATHALALHKGPIPTRQFTDHIQIVLSERNDDGVADQAVLSPRTWRIADLHTKHAMLRAGLGWGNLPEHLVREDLRARRLVAIRPAAWGEAEHTLHLSAIYRSDARFGPAHSWILRQLEVLCARDAHSARQRSSGRERARKTRKPSVIKRR
jgi:DNA-binding transcriptional LysR family regulator